MNVFDLEQARLGAALGLQRPEHFDEFQRLAKTLVHGPAFQFVVVECEDERVRERVIAALGGVLEAAKLSVSTLSLDRTIEDAADLEARLVEQARKHDVVHVFGVSYWFDDARWDAFNARRERIAHGARARLVFWLTPAAVKRLTLRAPDFWAWRAGLYAFEEPLAPARRDAVAPQPFEGRNTGVDPRGKVERHRRMTELRTALSSSADLDDGLRVALLDELAQLHVMRGDLDEALRIRREEELPVCERLDDVRSRAVTMSRIADILFARGELDEALRIRREEELPVYERLGNVRERAKVIGKTADILFARGELDEALHLLREEAAPAFERLGDVRSRAVTMGKIADILSARGELDEALRIRREEQLPVYESLGDVRERALTMGKIADTLFARGDLDEALRIWCEEELPVHERRGDTRLKALCLTNIAITLYRRNARGDRAEAERLLVTALADATRLGLAETGVIGEWLSRVKAGRDD